MERYPECETIDGKDVWSEKWSMYNLEDTLNFMKKHFFQSWYFATSEIHDIWDTKNSFYCFKRYLDYSYSHYKYAFKKWLSKVKHIRIAKSFCRKLKGCDYIITYDEYCTPCINVRFTKRKDADMKDIVKDVILYEKISETYFNNLDFYPMFVLDGSESKDEITDEDIKKDKELVELFYESAEEIRYTLDTKGNKDLQDDLGISKVVGIKIGGVLL